MGAEEHRTLLGVYPSRRRAEQVARSVKEAGVDPAAVHIGDPRDSAASLEAEMEGEVADSWGSPAAPLLFTKEMAKGAVLATVLGGIVGLLVALPFAFLLHWEPAPLRIALTLGIGVAFGATVGIVIGGGWSERRDHRLAAERGVPLRVDTARAEVAGVMTTDDVIRLDELDHGELVRTVTTEERRTVHNPLEDAEAAARGLATELRHGDEPRHTRP
jgi:hypothetical protein